MQGQSTPSRIALNIRQLFRDLLRPSPPIEGYREPAARTDREVIREIGEHVAALQLRVRMLEAQLASEGREPIYIPSRDEILAIAEVLESISRLDGHPPRLNTLEISRLARVMRGLLRV